MSDSMNMHREQKVSLTEKEISDILSFIKPLPRIPSDIAKEIYNKHFNDHAKQLREIKIYPTKIPILKRRLEEQYFRSYVQPGKAVGPLASSSIGEKGTQSSLSSKHTAGMSKLDLLEGIPRIDELLNCTRDIKTPSMDIYLRLPHEELTNLQIVLPLAYNILEYREIQDLLIDYDVECNRELSPSDMKWYTYHDLFYSTDYKSHEWSIRLIFNVHRLYHYRQTLTSICNIIRDNYGDAHIVASPDNIGIVDLYIDIDGLPDISTIMESIKSNKRRNKKEGKQRCLKEIILENDVKFNRVLTKGEKEWYKGQGDEYTEYEWSIRLRLDIHQIERHGSLENIAKSIENGIDGVVIQSLTDIIDIYIDVADKTGGEEIVEVLKEIKIMDIDEDDDEDNLITEDNKIHYFLRDLVIPSILNLQVGGIENITRCFFQQNKNMEWYISTKGSNLKAVIYNDLIDISRTNSNHLWDNFEVFGIEATKAFLEKEYGKLIAVSHRHISLLMHSQTHSGRPSAVSRYGIDRKQIPVMARVSYEQAFDNFFLSAFRAEKDPLTCVAGSIAFGQNPHLGSGYVSLFNKDGNEIDTSKIMHEYNKNINSSQLKTVRPVNTFQKPPLLHNNQVVARMPPVERTEFLNASSSVNIAINKGIVKGVVNETKKRVRKVVKEKNGKDEEE